MKGISAVVAMVLLLIITVAVAGMGQMFISGLVRTITPSEEELPGLIRELLGGGDGGGNGDFFTCDFRLVLQGGYTDYDLSDLCVNNRGFSMHSSAILCKDSFPGYDDPIEGFIGQTEQQIQNKLNNYLNNHPELNTNTTDYLLMNCEKPIHPRRWGTLNDNETLQMRYYNATKLRIQVVRETFPNATISLGPIIKPHKDGEYNPILERIEGYVRAGEQGVYDELDCLETRVFFRYGPEEENYIALMENMTRQALDVSSNLTNSSGAPIPLCVDSGFKIQGTNVTVDPDLGEVAKLQVEIVLTYPSVKLMSWWSGSFNESLHPEWLANLSLCELEMCDEWNI